MIKILKYSHGIHITWHTQQERRALYDYCRKFVEIRRHKDPQTREMVETKEKTYVSADPAFTGLALLLTDYDDLITHLGFCGLTIGNSVEVHTMPLHKGVRCDFKLRPGVKPLERQLPALEFALQPNCTNRILDADTGFGKTVAGYLVTAARGERCAYIMAPTHFITWTESITKFLDIDKEDIVVLSGTASFITAYEMAKANLLTAKIFLISGVTYRSYIRKYETGELDPRLPPPVEYMAALGIGWVLRDEVHEQPHATMKQYMHTNVGMVLGMSATIDTEDPFSLRQYRRYLPPRDTWVSDRNKHAIIRAMYYQSSMGVTVPCTGPFGYSHIKYEGKLLRSKPLLSSYLNIICEAVKQTYLTDYKPGMKMFILASTNEMIEQIVRAVKEIAPGKSVASYVQDTKNKKHVLHNTDIVVTTVGSGGTGKDVANLSHVLMTVALGTRKTFRQVMGRARPVKLYPDFSPVVMYLTNRSIPKHIEYDRRRRIDQNGKCKEFQSRELRLTITDRRGPKTFNAHDMRRSMPIKRSRRRR